MNYFVNNTFSFIPSADFPFDKHFAVRIRDNKGCKFVSNSFSDANTSGIQTIGISAVNADFEVYGNNRFTGYDHGLDIFATDPFASNVFIGEMPNTAGNTFVDNVIGIYASGGNLIVDGNEFEITNSGATGQLSSITDIAVFIFGGTKSFITNNRLTGMDMGMYFGNTEKNHISVTCNELENVNEGLYLQGDNSAFFFDKNNFNCSAQDIVLLEIRDGITNSVIPGNIPHQGININGGLTNRFSDINNAGNAYHFLTFLTTNEFRYYYADENIDPRYQPNCSSNGTPCPNGETQNFMAFLKFFDDIEGTPEGDVCTAEGPLDGGIIELIGYIVNIETLKDLIDGGDTQDLLNELVNPANLSVTYQNLVTARSLPFG